MTTKIKLYVDITQLANVSTEGLDLIVGMATQKCVENISSMATITFMGAPEVQTVSSSIQNSVTIQLTSSNVTRCTAIIITLWARIGKILGIL